MVGVIAMLVQFFYAWRIFVLTHNYYVVSLVILTSLGSGCALPTFFEATLNSYPDGRYSYSVRNRGCDWCWDCSVFCRVAQARGCWPSRAPRTRRRSAAAAAPARCRGPRLSSRPDPTGAPRRRPLRVGPEPKGRRRGNSLTQSRNAGGRLAVRRTWRTPHRGATEEPHR